MKFIIKSNEPFNGAPESILLDSGVVAFSDGMTFEEYCFENGPHQIVDEDELYRLTCQFEASMVSTPTEETFEQWLDALECLPPCRWGTHQGVELFHISERLSGSLVSWHARVGQRYWTFTDLDSANLDDLASKVVAAL